GAVVALLRDGHGCFQPRFALAVFLRRDGFAAISWHRRQRSLRAIAAAGRVAVPPKPNGRRQPARHASLAVLSDRTLRQPPDLRSRPEFNRLAEEKPQPGISEGSSIPLPPRRRAREGSYFPEQLRRQVAAADHADLEGLRAGRRREPVFLSDSHPAQQR